MIKYEILPGEVKIGQEYDEDFVIKTDLLLIIADEIRGNGRIPMQILDDGTVAEIKKSTVSFRVTTKSGINCEITNATDKNIESLLRLIDDIEKEIK